MKFILTPTHWILAGLDPIEWSFLERLPEIASGRPFSGQSRRRLSPDPIDVPAGDRASYEDFLQDWEDYVRPDLLSAYSAARDQVSRDLARALEEGDEGANEEESAGVPAKVAIDRASADAWYSALNQARLMLNEEYDLAEAVERFRPPRPGSPASKQLDVGRVMLLAQYEFYTALQSILIEAILSDPGASTDLTPAE